MSTILSWTFCFCLSYLRVAQTVSLAEPKEDDSLPLTRLEKSIRPLITEMGGSRTVRLGDPVTIVCEAFGAPQPVVWWTRNGVVVNPPQTQIDVGNLLEEMSNVGMKTYEQGSTKARLDIDCFTPEHQGIYTCVADNLHVSRANLSLNMAPLGDGSNLGCPENSGEKQLGSPPVIYMWSSWRVEVEGAKAQLFCRADGFPRPTVKWLQIDDTTEQLVPLEHPKGFKHLPNGDLMVIGASVCTPGGCALVCQASNANGEDKVEMYIYQTRKDKDSEEGS